VIVEDVKIMHDQAGLRAVHVNRHGIVLYLNHPENVIPINMNVVIVNLRDEAGRPNRAGIEVQSNKGKRASMLLAVRRDELALAKTHIGLECQPRGDAGCGVGTSSPTSDMREAHEPIEIRNL